MKSETAVRLVQELGLNVNLIKSGLSCSFYLEIDDYNEETDTQDIDLKIRFSDHELPPTYGNMHGYPDYTVGDFISMEEQPFSTFWDVLADICDKYGIAYSTKMKREFTRRANIASSKKAAEEKAKIEKINTLNSIYNNIENDENVIKIINLLTCGNRNNYLDKIRSLKNDIISTYNIKRCDFAPTIRELSEVEIHGTF